MSALAVTGVQNLDFNEVKGSCDVVLDTTEAVPLASLSGASAAKWSLRLNGLRYTGTVIRNESFDRVHLLMLADGADAGDDEISYSNAPSDVSDTEGRPLRAFSGFPV